MPSGLVHANDSAGRSVDRSSRSIAPPSECAIARLTEPKGSGMSIVSGADPSGRFVVGRGYPTDPYGDYRRYPVIWDRGVPTLVDLPGVDQLLEDVNSTGTAVGTSYDTDTWMALTPWLYRNRRLTALPGVTSGAARAINERGDIVGVRYTETTVPVWWPADGGPSRPVALPLPPGASSGEAFDVDEDGTIVGFYTDEAGVDRGYVWLPDGSGKTLPLPAGTGPSSSTFSIRNGWAVGFIGSADGLLPVRWHVRTNNVQVFPKFETRPNAVNRHGWMAGTGKTDTELTGRALFLHDTGGLILPGLANHFEPLGDIATELSDDGRTLAGQALDTTGALRAVQWRCR